MNWIFFFCHLLWQVSNSIKSPSLAMVKENQTIHDLVKVKARTRSRTGRNDWEHEKSAITIFVSISKIDI